VARLSIDRVERLCATGDDERSMRAALVDELRRALGFAWYAWLLTDPATEVGSAPLAATPSVPDLPRVIRGKYLTDVNRWTGLDGPAVSLLGAAEGHPERHRQWRDVLASYDVVDVASLAFRDRHGCWGWLDLWRTDEHGPFGDADLAALTSVAAPITRALRRAQARTFDGTAPPPIRSGPAVLLLAPDLSVRAQTPDTEAWLRALVPPDGDQRPVPAAAYNVAAQLLATEAGIDDHPPTARVHLHAGMWLTLRASRVDGDRPLEERDIAVAIEPSSAIERRDLFARAHGLSARESELLEHLAAGADTKAAAAALYVSEYTVQDHLKSVFAKTGTRNRRTLLARISGP
jgi:DNA-binding CsgD family transcriptional regulator